MSHIPHPRIYPGMGGGTGILGQGVAHLIVGSSRDGAILGYLDKWEGSPHPGMEEILVNPGILGQRLSHVPHPRIIPGWGEVLGNPGILGHGVAHLIVGSSRDGAILGYLDSGKAHLIPGWRRLW